MVCEQADGQSVRSFLTASMCTYIFSREKSRFLRVGGLMVNEVMRAAKLGSVRADLDVINRCSPGDEGKYLRTGCGQTDT
jgi:hypothetical protein